MPDLLSFLYKQDIGFLRNTAMLWGRELRARLVPAAAEELAALMLDHAALDEQIAGLPAGARKALKTLLESDGRLPWAAFARQFGGLRPAGPGRRDREQVHLHPTSATEVLYYRALVARGFFDTPTGLQEFACIPNDLLRMLKSTPAPQKKTLKPPGRQAVPKEYHHVLLASDRLLDDAVTLLAALRMGIEPPQMEPGADIIASLLRSAGVLAGDEPMTECLKEFLEAPRWQALALLAEAWRQSRSFNELRLLPGLVCEGEWENDPLAARVFFLGLLESLPPGRWWSLPAFIRAVKEDYPDFQRPAGDYDSWFIRRAADGSYLRGFACWDEVDGALLRFLICGPMYWLGKVDLAQAQNGGEITAFRRVVAPPQVQETEKLTVTSSGRISIPRLAPRLVRYQVARFCEWEAPRPDEYRYMTTVAALKRASGQGLKVTQLLSLLARHARAELPPSFVKGLKRWELNGTEARLEMPIVLRVSQPQVLEALRRSKAGRFLGDVLGATAVIIKPGAHGRVLAALTEMGLLAEVVGLPMDEGQIGTGHTGV